MTVKTIRKLCLLCALLLVSALLLAGCVKGSSEQEKAGKKLMRAYLAESGSKAKLTEVYAEVLRPDASTLVLSDYVKGNLKDGENEYEFAVNVVTGEIYTSEQHQAFSDSCVRLVCERLGLEPSDCVGFGELWMEVPSWQEPREEWPYQWSYLGNVLPVGITDMDAYAAQLFADEDIQVAVHIVCRNTEFSEERWNLADTAGWPATGVRLYKLGDASAELPAQEELNWAWFGAFTGEKLNLTTESITFVPAK